MPAVALKGGLPIAAQNMSLNSAAATTRDGGPTPVHA
jgi:hypothetical protein